ncbi:MAG: FtsQ-type protein [Microbacteriaceae bacterium]|nr:FtsQ-type protein [Microbacteriaceae bacterium]
MKRPEGFDPPGKQQPVPPARKPVQPGRQRATPQPAQPRQPTVGRAQKAEPSIRPPAPARGASSRAARPDAAARADLRAAARERRRVERAEVRRFTRRARNRRLAIAALAGTVVTLVGLVFVAVYSPILALRTITIDGTARIDPTELHTAIDGQMGTPLALIDFDRITTELSAFPLIRSYVTETVPPDTLLIHIVERQPVGSIKIGDTYRLVDPAGITVQESVDRVQGVPVIDLGGADASSPAFASVVEVLLALPPTLLAQVDSASARTRDDVVLVLAGVGQRVSWGSADDSAKKAALLAALIAVTDPARAGEFDVSAPGNGVFRPS